MTAAASSAQQAEEFAGRLSILEEVVGPRGGDGCQERREAGNAAAIRPRHQVGYGSERSCLHVLGEEVEDSHGGKLGRVRHGIGVRG